MNFLLLTEGAAATQDVMAQPAGSNIWFTLILIAVTAILFWFMILGPQKKEQKRVKEMYANMEVGDYVITTSGFYGVIIDITDEDVIVEFGNNKNCRIPMKRSAISQVEKANQN